MPSKKHSARAGPSCASANKRHPLFSGRPVFSRRPRLGTQKHSTARQTQLRLIGPTIVLPSPDAYKLIEGPNKPHYPVALNAADRATSDELAHPLKPPAIPETR